MIFFRPSSRLRQITIFHTVRMASESVNVKRSRKEFEEGISIRAQRRKRAYNTYNKQHNDKKVWKTSEELEIETSYYIENGLRKVYPYYYTFGSFIKGRWLGKTVLDVYTSEFQQAGIDPQKEIDNGNLTVNGKTVSLDFVLGNNMRMDHRCHRHEMPVLDVPIEIIDDTDELLVINKPASIPVHPCGRYRYNSVTMILKHEYGYDNLRILYRLDRLTSGVLILPKTTTVSKKLEKQLEDKRLHKEYVCRVVGKFPDGEVVCNEPLGGMSHLIALHKVDKNGKESLTTFTRLSYNGKTSVVKCVPHTGRTHQIRVHLQYLGYPICNDPLYNSPSFGPNRGKGGIFPKTDEEIALDIMKISNIGAWKIGENPKYIEKFGHQTTKDTSGLQDDKSERKTGSNEMEATDNMTEERPECSEIGGKEIDSDSELPHKRVKTEDGSTGCSDASKNSNGSHIETRSDNIDKTQDNIVSTSVASSKAENLENLGTNQDIGNDDNEKPDEVDIDKTSTSSEVKDESCDTEQCEKVEMVGKVTDGKLVESKVTIDEVCEGCKHLYQDPKLEELVIYLHAVRYKGPSFDYSTPLPDWARKDFVDENFTGT